MIRIEVPGKLMIAGEYAVLGPTGESLAMTVHPGLEVCAERAEDWRLSRADGGASWRTGEPVPADLTFAHAALMEARKGRALSPHHIETRVAPQVGSGIRKPGVGGSASATVGVVAAVLAAAGEPLRAEEILSIGVRTHRQVQSGFGSGYDVATISTGGLVCWRPARLAGGAGEREALRIPWPQGLQVLAGYTGRSASTTGLLTRLEDQVQSDRAAFLRGLTRLGAPVGQLIDAFVEADLEQIFAQVKACHEALCSWSDQVELPVVTPEVRAMIALAEESGAVAKVSGAGGGDSVLAFSDDASVLTRVRTGWLEAGFEPLPIQRCEWGVREVS